jgi:hypothetical protein
MLEVALEVVLKACTTTSSKLVSVAKTTLIVLLAPTVCDWVAYPI